MSLLIAASATMWGQREKEVWSVDFDWLHASPLGHQLVDELILETLQGLEHKSRSRIAASVCCKDLIFISKKKKKKER